MALPSTGLMVCSPPESTGYCFLLILFQVLYISPTFSHIFKSVKHTPALAFLSVHFLIFYIINQFLNPHPDMLDHWVWSRFLSLSYYEHPPMIAWLIRGITMVGGQSEAVLEVGSQLVTLFILTLIYAGTFFLYGRNSALVTLLILCSMP